MFWVEVSKLKFDGVGGGNLWLDSVDLSQLGYLGVYNEAVEQIRSRRTLKGLKQLNTS